MTEKHHTLAVVIPTIGRYDELRRMLRSLAAQTRPPDEVIITGEGEGNEQVAREFARLNARFINLPGSSICDARNAGIEAARPDADLIGFFDDDIVLEPQCLEALMKFWENGPPDLGGTGCNLVNHPPVDAGRLKRLRLTSRLGLYDSAKGAVLRSGFHTMMPGIQQDTWVRWLPSWAVVYSRKVLAEFTWDEWFESYSYLEDLDLSYRISKKYRLALVASARFYHYPSNVGRTNAYLFGKKEVLNRLYFVSKNPELSRPLCCLALAIRAAMSLSIGIAQRDFGYFKRVAGNFAGFLSATR
jgi:GT2 family glycosyltransferase